MLHNQHSPGERVGGEVVRGGEGVYIGGAHQGETQPQRVDTKVIVTKRKITSTNLLKIELQAP